MMMGIISDTLFFRSPTTTEYDKFIFNELQEIAQFDNPEQVSLDMFAAKSDLGDIAIRNLITMDYKVFEVNGKKFGAGTVETTNP
jgi:manganese-dependent inorganic pyrophosphatase